MRISLIRPRTGNTPDPPLGLLLLSACLKPYGHEVQVLDPGPDDDSVVTDILRFKPDMVGYSLLTTQVSRAREIHSHISRALPGIMTTAGGIHASSLPEWTLREFNLDFVVIGEGERTFPHAVHTLQTGGSLDEVPGIAFLKNDRAVRTPPRELIFDLDTIPFPDRGAVDFKRYLRPPGNIRGKLLRRATSIITSRGCPFGCIFCSSHELFGRRVRRRSVSNIIAEISDLRSTYAIDGLWFLDDTLLEDKHWLRELCGALEPMGIPWSCQAHVRRVDYDILRTMRAAGCLQIEFGVESGSGRMLRRLKKGSEPNDVRRAFYLCRRLGIRTLANFMIGIPGETEADAMASLRLAREIQPDHVVVTFTTPLPGSELYREAVENRWIPEHPDFSDKWIIRQIETPAITLTMDAETMMRIRKEFDNAFFWKNIRGYLMYPGFIAEIALHILKHPRRYVPGFKRALRTGRLLHLIETIWEEYNRI